MFLCLFEPHVPSKCTVNKKSRQSKYFGTTFCRFLESTCSWENAVHVFPTDGFKLQISSVFYHQHICDLWPCVHLFQHNVICTSRLQKPNTVYRNYRLVCLLCQDSGMHKLIWVIFINTSSYSINKVHPKIIVLFTDVFHLCFVHWSSKR